MHYIIPFSGWLILSLISYYRWNIINTALYSSDSVPTNDLYIATNALFYKYFEHWGFGKGIDVSHIINSGRSIGDAR